MTKFYMETLKKLFLEWEKMASRKIFWRFFHANFFMFILLISNHTVFFLIQFEITLHLWVFQKAEIALAFLKNSFMQFNSKLNLRPYMITYSIGMEQINKKKRKSIIIQYKHKCFTGNYTTHKIHPKPLPGPEWHIFHIPVLTSEDIDDVTIYFFMIVCAKSQFVYLYIIKRTSQSCWRYDFYFLVLKTIFHSLAALIHKILFLPLENNFFNFVPLCCVYVSLKFGNFCHLSLDQALKQGKFKETWRPKSVFQWIYCYQWH